MNSEIIFVVEEAAEGDYTAKALGAGIFTEAETVNELRENVRESVLTHFEDEEQPKIIRLHFVKEELIRL